MSKIPNKFLAGDFLEGLSTSIDNAIMENKPLTLMGDYNIKCLNRKERKCMDTALTPNGSLFLATQSPQKLDGFRDH